MPGPNCLRLSEWGPQEDLSTIWLTDHKSLVNLGSRFEEGCFTVFLIHWNLCWILYIQNCQIKPTFLLFAYLHPTQRNENRK